MSKRVWSMIALAGALLLSAPAGAGPVKDKGPKPPQAVKRLIFEDEDVLAGRPSGAGTIVEGQLRARLSRLIVIRKDFIPELLKSAEDL